MALGAAFAPAAQGQVKAKRANDFVETIGVATHFWVDQGKGLYGKDPHRCLQLMKDLGLRYYRGYYQHSYRDYGLKGTAWVALHEKDVNAKLNRYNGFENELIAVEGANEPNVCDGNIYNEVQSHQAAVYSAVKSRPALQHLPVLGPSMMFAERYDCLGNMTDKSDKANIHPYPGGDLPEQFYNNDGAKGLLPNHWMDKARQSHGNQGVWATETGYNTAINQGPYSNKPIREEIEAKYVPRMFAHFFLRGVERTMDYELMDEEEANLSDQEHHFGFVRNDWTVKPAYTSLQNTIKILDDRNATFATGSLSYSLGGDLADINQLLLQKGNGTYYLVLWQGVRSWNPYDSQPNNPIIYNIANRELTLNLGAAASRVRQYRPLDRGTTAFGEVSSTSSVKLSVPDHLLIVEISTGSAPVVSSAPIGQTISLKARANGNYVSAGTGGSNPLLASQTAVGAAERFVVEDAGNGKIALKAVANGRYVCADNQGASPLIANRTSAGPWERFEWVSLGSGRVALRAEANSQYVCADNQGASALIANRASVGGTWEEFEWANASGQLLANGIYKLTSQISVGGTPRRVLDVDNGRDANNTNVWLHHDNASNAQRWYFEHVGDNVYKIVSQVGGKTRVLDANNTGGLGDRSDVHLYDDFGNANQRWKVEAVGNGTYKLTVAASLTGTTRYCLDVDGGVNADKQNVQVYRDNGLAPQQWLIEPATLAPGPVAATTQRVEAEAGTLTGVAASSQGTGYSGAGYINGSTLDQTGDQVSVTFSVPTAGTYPLTIGYNTQPFGDQKYQELLVNGGAARSVRFPLSTGWATVTESVSLRAGSNTIVLRKGWGWMHVDYFELGPAAATTAARSTASAPPSVAAATPAAEPSQLSAYPNPSPDGKTTLRLHTKQAQRATVQVYNQQGTLVSLLTVPLREGQTEFRLPASLPQGTYYLKTRLDGQAQQFTLKVD